MPPTLADRVRHIWDAIREIELALATVSYEQFSANLLLRLAVERLLEIVCEASKHIPADVKAAEDQIPWQKITDFGNRLRHAYHEVDSGIVWQVTQHDLEQLKNLVERIIRNAGEEP